MDLAGLVVAFCSGYGFRIGCGKDCYQVDEMSRGSRRARERGSAGRRRRQGSTYLAVSLTSLAKAKARGALAHGMWRVTYEFWWWVEQALFRTGSFPLELEKAGPQDRAEERLGRISRPSFLSFLVLRGTYIPGHCTISIMINETLL